MGKIAFVFSGQGAQYPGMGKELYNNISECASVFNQAEALRKGTIDQCFNGTKDELATTINTQPCMFTMELGAAAAVTKAGIVPSCVAGFSLGEVAAATFTNVMSFEDGFKMVCLRGELMDEDAKAADGAMAAVLKLSASEVESLCSKFEHVYPVNYNCPGQISVSGLADELKEFISTVKEAGGKAIPLKVKGGFHSPLMNRASESFSKALENIELSAPSITLYSNYTGLPYEGEYSKLLSRQINNPVKWETIIRHMLEDGIDTFVELGPGTTLCGMISKIEKDAKVYHVENHQSLEETVFALTQAN